MKFFVKVSEFCAPADDRKTQQDQILLKLKKECWGFTSCNDAYLATEYCTGDNFVFGADNPEEILKAAKGWNDTITARLHAAIEAYLQSPRQTTLSDLKEAAMAADDDLCSYGDEAVFIPDSQVGTVYWLHPKLHEDQFDEVMAHPENFAIVEVPTE